MKIAMVTSNLSQRGGGVRTVIEALSLSVQKQGNKVKVFGLSDQAWKEDDCKKWRGAEVEGFPILGPRAIGYAPRMLPALESWQPDVVHAHGLWMYPSSAVLRHSRENCPRVISTHGMLDSWATQNSVYKKRVASIIYENSNLRGAACLHALCEAERESIRNYGLKNPIAVIPNGVDITIATTPSEKPNWWGELPKGARILLFLGRIHKKKGLVSLLQAWAALESTSANNNWHLVIAGWDQGKHMVELTEIAQQLGILWKVHFVGPQYGPEKHASLTAADAFILPSISEGLPMSILEAWAYSLPVLMTQECNLSAGFSANAAIEIGTTAKEITYGINKLVNMSDQTRKLVGLNGLHLVEMRFKWETIAGQMQNLYEWVKTNSEIPSFVEVLPDSRRKDIIYES